MFFICKKHIIFIFILFLSPTVSVGQECRRSLVDGSGLGSLMRLCSDGSWGCSRLKCWLGPEDSIPRWRTHRADIFVLEMIGVSSLPYPLFLGAVWGSLKHISWLLPDQVIQKKRKEEVIASYMMLASEVTPCLFCNILLGARRSPHSVWEGTTQSWIPWSREHWG